MIETEEFQRIRHPKHGLRFGGLSPRRADVGEMITVQNSGCWKGVNVDDPDRDPDIDRVVRQGRGEIYRNYGVSAAEFDILLSSFIDEM